MVARKKIKTLSSFRKFLFKKGKKDWSIIDDNLLKLFLNVLANIVHDDMKIKPTLLKHMALYKRQIRTLANTSQNNIQDKHDFLNKQRNQKGGLLPIFAALIPIITKIAAVAAPLIGKAALGVGSAAAAGAAGSAVAHKLQQNV